MDPREIVAQWIEDRGNAKDSPALAWCIQRAGFHLLTCYPEDRGADILWGVFRVLAPPGGTAVPGKRAEG